VPLQVPARGIPEVREDGVDALLHLWLIHVVLEFAALNLPGLVDGHLLEKIRCRPVRHPVAQPKILASGPSRQERRQHQRPAPHNSEDVLHQPILARAGQRELSASQLIRKMDDYRRQQTAPQHAFPGLM